MSSVHDQLPGYLLGKYQLTWTVTFTALFSLVVVLLYSPYNSNIWFELGFGGTFVLTVSFFVVCLLLIVGSKMLMYKLKARIAFTVAGYCLWNFIEILLVALMYSLFTVCGIDSGIIDCDAREFFSVFADALLFAVSGMGIPYVIAFLHLSLEDKSNTIRLMNYGNVVSDIPAKPYEEKRITLFDNNGVLKFSISSENLYFIESDDNYIKVWYTDSSGEVRQYMLRCRLKTVEDSFADSDLVRCHRKYIVNISKVSILKAEKEGYKISLGLDNVDTIPISKTYEPNVLARFNSK